MSELESSRVSINVNSDLLMPFQQSSDMIFCEIVQMDRQHSAGIFSFQNVFSGSMPISNLVVNNSSKRHFN